MDTTMVCVCVCVVYVSSENHDCIRGRNTQKSGENHFFPEGGENIAFFFYGPVFKKKQRKGPFLCHTHTHTLKAAYIYIY
jgi:hypothetical protein